MKWLDIHRMTKRWRRAGPDRWRVTFRRWNLFFIALGPATLIWAVLIFIWLDPPRPAGSQWSSIEVVFLIVADVITLVAGFALLNSIRVTIDTVTARAIVRRRRWWNREYQEYPRTAVRFCVHPMIKVLGKYGHKKWYGWCILLHTPDATFPMATARDRNDLSRIAARWQKLLGLAVTTSDEIYEPFESPGMWA